MKPIAILNAAANEALKQKYPMIRPELLPPSKLKQSTANQLTAAIIKWVQLNGGQAERINIAGKRIDNTRIVTDVLGFQHQIGSVTWAPSTMTKGTADISATIKGRSVKIEVKIGKDRQSEAQKGYQAQVERAGGVYVIAKTFDGFYEWYNEFIKT